jgi:thioredoxin 1
MDSFNDIIQSEKPVLVDFYATWCGPCKMMDPILKELSGLVGESARILKIDVDRNPAAASSYNVMGVPTLIIFKRGKVVWRESGVVDAATLKRHLDNAAIA